MEKLKHKHLPPIWIAVILGVILLLISGGVGYVWYAAEREAKKAEDTAKETPAAEKDLTEEVTVNEVDANWNLVTNKKAGYSIKIPKVTYDPNGACEYVSASDHSYRPRSSEVPVTVLSEDSGKTYIVPEYYWELSGETTETKNGGTTHYYSKCTKTTRTIASMEDEDNKYHQGWIIDWAEVKSDAQVSAFIGNQYGKGCGMESKKETAETGVFDVAVKSAGMEDPNCVINFAYVLKYSPSKERVVGWTLGQSYSFFAKGMVGMDEEMTSSFKFL